MVSAATMLARAEPQMPTRPLVHLVAAVALPVGRTCRYGEHVPGRQIQGADTGVPQGDPQWVLDRRMQPHDLLNENRYVVRVFAQPPRQTGVGRKMQQRPHESVADLADAAALTAAVHRRCQQENLLVGDLRRGSGQPSDHVIAADWLALLDRGPQFVLVVHAEQRRPDRPGHRFADPSAIHLPSCGAQLEHRCRGRAALFRRPPRPAWRQGSSDSVTAWRSQPRPRHATPTASAPLTTSSHGGATTGQPVTARRSAGRPRSAATARLTVRNWTWRPLAMSINRYRTSGGLMRRSGCQQIN